MLSNAYLLGKFRFDTAENEQNFAEILPKTDNYSPASKRGLHLEERERLAEAVCTFDRAGEHLQAPK